MESQSSIHDTFIQNLPNKVEKEASPVLNLQILEAYMNEFIQNLVIQTMKYEYEAYKSLVINFKAFILEGIIAMKGTDGNKNLNAFKDSMNQSSSNGQMTLIPQNYSCLSSVSGLGSCEQFNKINFLIIQAVNYMINYDNIFLNDSLMSFEVTFDLILTLIESNVIEGKLMAISYLHKLVELSKISYVAEEYLAKITGILNSKEKEIGKNDDFYGMLQRIKQSHVEQKAHFDKNLIKLFESFDATNINGNTSECIKDSTLCQNSSIINDIEIFDSFKKRVNTNLHNEDIINLYRDLKNESDIIEKAMNNKFLGPYYFSSVSNINLKYLYLFKKILDVIDSTTNPFQAHLFYNLIFRSSLFTQYLLKEVYINHNFIVFKNKEIYLEKYPSVSQFFIKNLLNFDEGKTHEYRKFSTMIYHTFAKLITSYLQKKVPLSPCLQFLEVHIEESSFHSEIFSYMCCSPFRDIFNELALNVNIYNTNKTNLAKILTELKDILIKYSIVERLEFGENVIYLHLSTQFAKCFKLMITFNQNEVFRCNYLSSYLFSEKIFLNLFVIIKFWAFQRKMFYSINHALGKISHCDYLFDNSMLMQFILYYLINIGMIAKVNFSKPNEINKYISQRYFRENREKSEYETQEIYYVAPIPRLIPNRIIKEAPSKSLLLGKYLVNFYYFILSLIAKAKEHSDVTFQIDLYFDFLVSMKQKEGEVLQFADYLLKILGNELFIKFPDMNRYCKELRESLGNPHLKNFVVDRSQKGVEKLISYDTKQIELLEKEVNRILHYMLNEKDECLVKGFISQRESFFN